MCRLLAYLGPPVQMAALLYQPEHSLIVQSYQPKEMTSGVVNADGFGLGWYRSQGQVEPFAYKNTLPIWSDINLPPLSRYVESSCMLACVRSATAGQPVDLSNCQPFGYRQLLGVHNGFIERFRETLYRPIRDLIHDDLYQQIGGSTDSEHIFALFFHIWRSLSQPDLLQALKQTLATLADLAQSHQTQLSANLIASDGKQLVACRFATRSPAPSLYWLRDNPRFPLGTAIASEPLFEGNWTKFPEQSLLSIGADRGIQTAQL